MVMADEPSMTMGELGRAVARIEEQVTALNETVTEAFGPLSVHAVLHQQHLEALRQLNGRVEVIQLRAAFIAGAVAAAGALIEWALRAVAVAGK
jgi:hypothetical protein